jgi:prolyl-tRNA synthetase
MLDVYLDFARNEAAVPAFVGRKSDSERFPGADLTYSLEAMMGDKKALQAATSHNLGQNFARAFDIQYLDHNNEMQYCWTTSWGLSTRFIGAMIMIHGDDQGLILPPRLAPHQVVMVPIHKNEIEKAAVMEVVERIRGILAGADVRVKVDDREGLTPGFKFNDWELRGVPLRLEIGPRDVAKGSVALARRDVPGREGKSFVPQDGLDVCVTDMLATIQQALLERATAFRDENTHLPHDYAHFKDVVTDGFAFAGWCGGADCETAIKDETKATNRCIPFEQPDEKGACIYCGKPAIERVYFARAY